MQTNVIGCRGGGVTDISRRYGVKIYLINQDLLDQPMLTNTCARLYGPCETAIASWCQIELNRRTSRLVEAINWESCAAEQYLTASGRMRHTGSIKPD